MVTPHGELQLGSRRWQAQALAGAQQGVRRCNRGRGGDSRPGNGGWRAARDGSFVTLCCTGAQVTVDDWLDLRQELDSSRAAAAAWEGRAKQCVDLIGGFVSHGGMASQRMKGHAHVWLGVPWNLALGGQAPDPGFRTPDTPTPERAGWRCSWHAWKKLPKRHWFSRTRLPARAWPVDCWTPSQSWPVCVLGGPTTPSS